MAKLTGAKKKAFLERMAKGRKKAAKKNPRKKATKNAQKNSEMNYRTRAALDDLSDILPIRKIKFAGGYYYLRAASGEVRTVPAAAANTAWASAGWPKSGKWAVAWQHGSRFTGTVKNPKRKTGRKAKKKPTGRVKTDIKTGRVTVVRGPAKKTPKRNPKRRRRNSDLDDAVKMYESFHQKAPGQIVEYEEFVRFPGNFAEMGKLKKLRVFLDEANPNFEFTGFGDCQVLCTPDGQNLYLMGGDQSINLAELDISSEKDIIELGPCVYIMYHTTKGFHDFEPTDYYHQFGEDDGIFPRLGYDRLNGRMFFIGGNYQVKREGIVN